MKISQNKILFVLLGAIIFLSFVFFSYLVHKDLFTQTDFNITVKLQDRIPMKFDTVFSLFSEVGKFQYMLLFLGVLLVIRRKWWGVITFALFGFMHVFELYGKFFVNHPPPAQFMLRTQHLIPMDPFYVRSDFSYPSGHAGRAAFISVVILMFTLQSKRLNLSTKMVIFGIICLYDVVMFVSRVYLGEHWTTDIIGGALLGFSLGLLGAIFL